MRVRNQQLYNYVSMLRFFTGEGMKSEEVIISGVGFLFITTFLEWLGMSPTSAPSLGALLVALTYLGGSINLWVGRNAFRDDISRHVVIPLEDRGVYQTINLSVQVVSDILINLAGVIIPLALSATAIYKIANSLPSSIEVFTLLTLFLTLLYNRLTKVIKGSGLGIPLITVTALTVLPSLAIAEELSNPSISALLTFSSSAIATLVGVDLLNLRNTSLFKSRYIVIGGMGVADAVFLVPMFSSLIVFTISSML